MNRWRLRKSALGGLVFCTWCVLLAMMPPFAFSQQVPDRPVQTDRRDAVDHPSMIEQPARSERIAVRPTEGTDLEKGEQIVNWDEGAAAPINEFQAAQTCVGDTKVTVGIAWIGRWLITV